MPPIIQAFRPEHPRVPITVRERLEERKSTLTGQLQSALNWDDYQRRVGVINGIGEAIAMCIEAEQALRG